MEHAQRVVVSMKDSYSRCLNPYFNGTCSKRATEGRKRVRLVFCLNPYFNGTCSKSVDDNFKDIYDSGLNPYFNGTCSKRKRQT